MNLFRAARRMSLCRNARGRAAAIGTIEIAPHFVSSISSRGRRLEGAS